MQLTVHLGWNKPTVLYSWNIIEIQVWCWDHGEGLMQFSLSGETSTDQTAEASPRLCSCYFCFAPLQVLISVVITLPKHEVWGGARRRKREGRAGLFHSPCVGGVLTEHGLPARIPWPLPDPGGWSRGALARGGEEPDRNIDCPFNVIWHQRRWKQRTQRENCNLNAPLGDSAGWIGGLALPEMSLWDPF